MEDKNKSSKVINGTLIPICPLCKSELRVYITLSNESDNTMTSLCNCMECPTPTGTNWEIIWNDTEVISIERSHFM